LRALSQFESVVQKPSLWRLTRYFYWASHEQANDLARRAQEEWRDARVGASVRGGSCCLLLIYVAAAFNQDVGGWDTSKVTSVDWILYEAAAFNQDVIPHAPRIRETFTRPSCKNNQENRLYIIPAVKFHNY
jgi:hypothetical protein